MGHYAVLAFRKNKKEIPKKNTFQKIKRTPPQKGCRSGFLAKLPVKTIGIISAEQGNCDPIKNEIRHAAKVRSWGNIRAGGRHDRSLGMRGPEGPWPNKSSTRRARHAVVQSRNSPSAHLRSRFPKVAARSAASAKNS